MEEARPPACGASTRIPVLSDVDIAPYCLCLSSTGAWHVGPACGWFLRVTVILMLCHSCGPARVNHPSIAKVLRSPLDTERPVGVLAAL